MHVINLLNQFAEFLEKQDMLSKLTENEKLHSYGYSEIHVIAAIGDLEEPNVTALAKTLRLTKGAVSKITKRLISSNVIEAYTIPDNRQKIFYRLLEKGRFLYEEHEKRHKLWLERDRQFLSQFTELQLEEFSKFMSSYNGYLEEQIRQLGGREDAD
ncbi:MarR family transcriptional regulator [Blautia producta]|uniref:MarR family transcriptional regulator n=1 Tax=Blautia producta TaxID=33035 RepID=UPI0031B5EE04